MKPAAVKSRAAGGGRKPDGKTARVPLGVSRVAPDVAKRIADAPEGRVAFLEALVRAAPPVS